MNDWKSLNLKHSYIFKSASITQPVHKVPAGNYLAPSKLATGIGRSCRQRGRDISSCEVSNWNGAVSYSACWPALSLGDRAGHKAPRAHSGWTVWHRAYYLSRSNSCVAISQIYQWAVTDTFRFKLTQLMIRFLDYNKVSESTTAAASWQQHNPVFLLWKALNV